MSSSLVVRVASEVVPTIEGPQEVVEPLSVPGHLWGAYAAAAYLRSVAPGSLPTMRCSLNKIACLIHPGLETKDGDRWPFVAWHQLRHHDVQAVRAQLLKEYAPATTNKMLAALTGVLRSAWRIGYMDTGAYHHAADVKRAKVGRSSTGRSISSDEMTKLVYAARQHAGLAGPRDAALIATMYGSGLRRAEIVSLAVDAYNPKDGSLRVRGKGNKDRVTYLAPKWRDPLEMWIAIYDAHPDQPLFPRLHRTGVTTQYALSVSAVNRLLTALQDATGVEAFTPHDTRRSFATGLLDAGVDIATVRDLLGHESVDTTANYDRRGEVAKQAAVAKL